MSKLGNNIVRIAPPLILAAGILYWMYRGFDFRLIGHVMVHRMDWTWMLLSFPFGIMAQAFRGWRWRQTLEPLGEKARLSVSINSIFISYALSLIIPRSGEFARCGVIKRWDGVSFSKAIGTVVTERAIDTLLLAIVVGLTLLLQIHVFSVFFYHTGTNFGGLLRRFSLTGWIVSAVCAAAAILLIWWLLRRLTIYNKVKTTMNGMWQGVLSVKNVKNPPLFIIFTLAIWICYFLHYYLTFFCFSFTEHLGLTCALVTFVVGTIAVVVPTPNGAGPWHFAVKTMLILYGVADTEALYFVLIVHTVQTMLVVLLGVYAWIALILTKKTYLQ